jgi:hypothetical protein
MHCLRSLGSRVRGFESPPRAWMFSVCVYVCVFLCLRRADHPPRSPTDCLRSTKPKWNGEFHGGRPRPNWGCSTQKNKQKKNNKSGFDEQSSILLWSNMFFAIVSRSTLGTCLHGWMSRRMAVTQNTTVLWHIDPLLSSDSVKSDRFWETAR